MAGLWEFTEGSREGRCMCLGRRGPREERAHLRLFDGRIVQKTSPLTGESRQSSLSEGQVLPGLGCGNYGSPLPSQMTGEVGRINEDSWERRAKG